MCVQNSRVTYTWHSHLEYTFYLENSLSGARISYTSLRYNSKIFVTVTTRIGWCAILTTPLGSPM